MHVRLAWFSDDALIAYYNSWVYKIKSNILYIVC